MADREEEIFEDESSELFEHYRIEADKGQALLRIDKFLSDRIPNVSRSSMARPKYTGGKPTLIKLSVVPTLCQAGEPSNNFGKE